MTDRARGPQTLKGALVSVASSGSTEVIAFQYNPATLKRTLQPQMAGGEENDRSEAIRFTGAPVQIIQVEIELDATDQLDQGNPVAVQSGISPQLSALELLAYPDLGQVNQNQSQLESGTIEVAPLTAPRTLFVWGSNRVLPVRINSYTISEEVFDANLNPIQAIVSLSMRVLNYSDLTADNKEYHQFMVYQQNMITLANQALFVNTTGVATSEF
jgi:hypothetical protein